MSQSYFHSFTSETDFKLLPQKLNDPFGTLVPEICKQAATEVQHILTQHQEHLLHDFGFEKEEHESVRGKMFGVLIVKNQQEEIGYLYTSSGKIDSGETLKMVPSLFHTSADLDFLTKGMTELSALSSEIKLMENKVGNQPLLNQLIQERSDASHLLQQWIFERYDFLNTKGESKNLLDIFSDYSGKRPPAGAGECAAPKLLHYAFEKNFTPLAIAEFWWGKSNKSKGKVHKEFYPACQDKCVPILSYMLGE